MDGFNENSNEQQAQQPMMILRLQRITITTYFLVSTVQFHRRTFKFNQKQRQSYLDSRCLFFS